MGATASMSTGQVVQFSNSAEFRKALENDLQGMALMPACTFQATDGYSYTGDNPPVRSHGIYASSDPQNNTIPLSTGGLQGMLSGFKDSKGNYICSNDENIGDGYGRDLNSPYTGKNPTDIITGGATPADAAYPYFVGENLVSYEIFAEIYSTYAGFGDLIDDTNTEVNGSDGAIGAGFVCTKLYVEKLTIYGRLPTAFELSTTGYNVPDTVPPGDPDAGIKGFGSRLHACDGSLGELLHYGFGA